MPWCPKCKNEYRPGILQCAECKVPLVDSLEDIPEKGEKEAPEEDFLDTVTVQEEVSFSEDEPEEQQEEDVPETNRRYHAYQKSADKAEDNKSSAYTLFLVGGIGLIADVLVIMGVIPLYQDAGYTKYLVCGVMGAMFVLFLVFGGVSMRNSKILMGKAKTEDSLQSEITKWCNENLTAEMVDEGINQTDIPDEQKYFSRAEKMKSLISDKFLNLDEDFLDHFVDDYYRKLFEE
jgi:uncharacterized membrane protein